MVPSLIFDLSSIDLDQVQIDAEGIERINPHRGQMRLLDGIIYANDDFTEAVAFKDVGADEFWVAGHIPGRPLFPGVLMIEAAAQLASFLTMYHVGVQDDQDRFVGFVGADAVKFRGQVVLGDRLVLLSKITQLRRNRCTCASQGLVKGVMVFEAVITGMLI